MKLKILYVSLFCSFLSLAQSPNGITYQAVIRAGEDVIVSNQTISVNIKIKQGSSSGIDVYSEKHSVTSNTNGLITLIIGKGTTTNNFSDIDWSQGPYFVESSYDLQGGENYTISNTSQLLSVPYALYAENAGNTTAGPPGTPGEEGKSAYQIWLALGNTGSEAEFLTSLTGPQGIAGKNSLTKTSEETAGSNCANGGVKIQVGLDINSNGVLDDEEINESSNKYLCTPSLPNNIASVLVGSILSYAGQSVPDGYLICDGTEISRTTYTNLFNVLGTAWGSGNTTTTFNLPDLRGRFLRGVDSGIGNDPNSANRVALNTGGNIGDNVGSYQNDEFKSHNHEMKKFGNSNGYQSQGIEIEPTSTQMISTGFTGGAETRPKNAYVYFIIKY